MEESKLEKKEIENMSQPELTMLFTLLVDKLIGTWIELDNAPMSALREYKGNVYEIKFVKTF